MKKFLRMLISTAAAAAVLAALWYANAYFNAQSMLGPTVGRAFEICVKALAAVTLLLYARCWLSLAVDAVRAHRAPTVPSEILQARGKSGVHTSRAPFDAEQEAAGAETAEAAGQAAEAGDEAAAEAVDETAAADTDDGQSRPAGGHGTGGDENGWVKV